MPRYSTAPRRKAAGGAGAARNYQPRAVTGRGAYRPRARAVTGRGAYQRRGLYGRGFYKGFGRDLGSALGGLASTAFGLGAGPGAALGGALGGLGSRMTGFGAYEVKRNTITQSAPSVSNPSTVEGCVKIRHKEYIGDVYSGPDAGSGQSDFKIAGFSINPGLGDTFPWLSQIAGAFEQYKITGMLFAFSTSSGDMTATSAGLGDVIMSTEYNALAAPPTNKRDMLNMIFSVAGKPSRDILHPIECDPRTLPTELFFVRNGDSDPPGGDIRFSDMGNFYIATQGCAPNVNLGSLMVTYDVEFYKPRLTSLAETAPSAQYNWTVANYNSPPLVAAPVKAFGTHELIFNPTGGAAGIGSITLPADLPEGHYQLMMNWNGLPTKLADVAAAYVVSPGFTSTDTNVDIVWQDSSSYPVVVGAVGDTEPAQCWSGAAFFITGNDFPKVIELTKQTGQVGNVAYASTYQLNKGPMNAYLYLSAIGGAIVA